MVNREQRVIAFIAFWRGIFQAVTKHPAQGLVVVPLFNDPACGYRRECLGEKRRREARGRTIGKARSRGAEEDNAREAGRWCTERNTVIIPLQ